MATPEARAMATERSLTAAGRAGSCWRLISPTATPRCRRPRRGRPLSQPEGHQHGDGDGADGRHGRHHDHPAHLEAVVVEERDSDCAGHPGPCAPEDAVPGRQRGGKKGSASATVTTPIPCARAVTDRAAARHAPSPPKKSAVP